MKKFWAGVAILLILALLGLLSGLALHDLHRELSGALSQAGSLAATNWEKANALATAAKAKWEKNRHLASAIADHEPLEQMDSLFAQLAVYTHPDQWAQYAAICADLASLAEAVGEEQLLLWWNLL